MVLVDTYWHFGTHWYSEDLEKDDNCDGHEVKAAIKGWSGLVDNDERNDDVMTMTKTTVMKEDDDEEGEDIGEEDDDEHEVKAVVESWSGLVTVGDAEEDDDDIR